MAGFFKLPHALYRVVCRDPNTLRVYCELASRARWTAGTCLGSHGIVDLSIGQCVIGRAEIAAALGLTERAVRTSLDRLSRLGALAVESTKRGTVVTVHEQWPTAEAGPAERPSTSAENDQAPDLPATIRTPTNEEARRTEGKKKGGQGERRKAATPLPEAWAPRNEDCRLSGQQHEHELAKFRDYAKANDWRKQDWDATWRVWQRKAVEFAPTGRRPAIAVGGAPPSNNFGTEMRAPRLARVEEL